MYADDQRVSGGGGLSNPETAEESMWLPAGAVCRVGDGGDKGLGFRVR